MTDNASKPVIFAGMRGYLRGAPRTILTIQPVFPGSFQAKRVGYRWVCLDPSGSLVFAPFRDFILLPSVEGEEKTLESADDFLDPPVLND